jgi:hypothetical protein
VSAGEEEDDQRRRLAVGDEHVRVRRLRGAAEGVPAQVQRGTVTAIPGHLCEAGRCRVGGIGS